MEKYSRLKPQGIVVVFVFNVPPTAKVIWRRGHGFKSHPIDWDTRYRVLIFDI